MSYFLPDTAQAKTTYIECLGQDNAGKRHKVLVDKSDTETLFFNTEMHDAFPAAKDKEKGDLYHAQNRILRPQVNIFTPAFIGTNVSMVKKRSLYNTIRSLKN